MPHEPTVEILFKKLHPDARIPKLAYPGDACVDLFPVPDLDKDVDKHWFPFDAVVPANRFQIRIEPGETRIIHLGFATAIPEGWEATIRTRSSQGFRNDVRLHPGTIDAGYRNEWSVKVFNLGKAPYYVDTDVAVAQCAIRRVPNVIFTEVDKLPESERGMKGFGSSDRS